MTAGSESNLNSRGVSQGMVVIVVALAVAAAAFEFVSGVVPSQTLFHTGIGQWIASNQNVPRVNVWSVVGANEPWTTPCWLYDVVLAQFSTLSPDCGFTALSYALNIAILSATYAAARGFSASRPLRLFVAFLVAMALQGRELEPAFVGAAGAIVALWASLSPAQDTFAAGNKPLDASGSAPAHVRFEPSWFRIFGTVVLLVVLTQIHAAAVFGIAGAALVRAADRRSAAVLVLVAIITVFLSPYVGIQAVHWTEAATSEFLDAVLTTASPMTIYSWEMPAVAMLTALAVIRSIKAGPFLLSLTLAVAGAIVSLAAKDFVPFATFLLVLSLLSAGYKSGGQPAPRDFIEDSFERFAEMGVKVLSVSPVGFAWVLLCYSIVKMSAVLFVPWAKEIYPAELVGALEDTDPNKAAWYPEEIGDYLVFAHQGDSSRKVLHDHRARLFDPQLHSITVRAQSGRTFPQKVAESFHVSRVLAPVGTPLSLLLESSCHWGEVTRTTEGPAQWRLFSQNPNFEPDKAPDKE